MVSTSDSEADHTRLRARDASDQTLGKSISARDCRRKIRAYLIKPSRTLGRDKYDVSGLIGKPAVLGFTSDCQNGGMKDRWLTTVVMTFNRGASKGTQRKNESFHCWSCITFPSMAVLWISGGADREKLTGEPAR